MWGWLRIWSKGYSYENTRQYLRLPAAWPIKYEPKQVPAGHYVTETQDISAGGVRVQSREMLPIGTQIHIEVHVPVLNRNVSAEGQVVRCLPARGGGFELGIRFLHIEPQDRAALGEAVEQFLTPRQRGTHKRTWWRKLS